ncbi:hypothetical protein ACET3Z_007549 [Daucus carota]
MDIPFSRFQCLSFEQIKNSCKFPFLHSNFRRLHEISLISRKSKIPLFQISCSYVEQGLKPRPVPKPSRIEVDEEKVNVDKPRIGGNSSGLAGQIEKLVVYKRYKEALELFEILEIEGDHDLGSSTYDALVDACISLRSIRGVKRVFSFMINSGFEPDQYLRNRMLLMHVKCKMMIDARYLFDEMPERNLVSWNTIIGGLVDSGDYVEAFRLFLTAWEEYSDLGVGCRSFATMIRAAAGLERLSPGRQLHSITVKMGIAGDVFLSSALIDIGALQQGCFASFLEDEIYGIILQSGADPLHGVKVLLFVILV